MLTHLVHFMAYLPEFVNISAPRLTILCPQCSSTEMQYLLILEGSIKFWVEKIVGQPYLLNHIEQGEVFYGM